MLPKLSLLDVLLHVRSALRLYLLRYHRASYIEATNFSNIAELNTFALLWWRSATTAL